MMKNSKSIDSTNSDKIFTKYNTLFEEYLNMKLDGKPKYVLKKCKELSSAFSHPKDMAPCYMSTFSHKQWEKLSIAQKLYHSASHDRSAKHSSSFPSLTHAFPCKKWALIERQLVDVFITEPDVSLPPIRNCILCLSMPEYAKYRRCFYGEIQKGWRLWLHPYRT